MSGADLTALPPASGAQPGPGRGRKPRYTAEQVAQALREGRGLVTHAAKRLACRPHTVLDYVKRHEICAQARAEAREALVDAAEDQLGLAVEAGAPWAVTFVLRTVGKDRGYVERSEQQIDKEVRVRVEYAEEPVPRLAQVHEVPPTTEAVEIVEAE